MVATGPHVPPSSPDLLTVVRGVAAVAAVLLALAVLTGDGLRAWRARRQAQKAPTGPLIESHGYYQRIPPGVLTTRLDDVAGIAEAKREVGELIDFLRDPAKYQRLGAHIPRGFLLHGPPFGPCNHLRAAPPLVRSRCGKAARAADTSHEGARWPRPIALTACRILPRCLLAVNKV